MEAIQREAQAVNVALIMVASITIAAFCLCVILYGFNRRKQARARRAREEERALHAEQLAQALRAAEVANESKSAFLANMSHDIRTPMNAVLGFTTIIEKEADNPAKVRDCAGKIMASGRHLLDLINDVLDISKIESGKASLTLAEFDLGDSLAAVESIIAPMARDKGQTFCAEIRSVRHERLIGDETHLNQILLNLLSNAVKYTPEGGRIWLRFIGLPAHSNALEHLRIEVEDDGYGMTPEFLKTIFDSFTRAENSTTNKVQGTGLGMSITKSLVDLMGGTIEVESEVGKGSLFRVDLELRIPEEQAAGYFWERAGIKGMLVADASPAAHGAIAEFMEGTGVEVDGAASADAACELARARGGYDVVLVGVPWLDDAAVRAADGLRASAETPLLFMLEHAFDQDDDVALPPGAAVLTKPSFPSMLKQKIEAVRGVDAEGDDDLAQVLSGKHFLAAEDNFLNAGILTDLLEMEGATVEIVENGKLAVERFERCEPGEFDAILMDVQMPVMNGHAAAQAIRALARADAATIPIFAMTADAFVEDEKAALAAGMNAHVAKPLEIDELRRAVDRFVEKGRSCDLIASKRVRKGAVAAVALVGALVLGACSAPAPAENLAVQDVDEERTVNFFSPMEKISPDTENTARTASDLTIAMAEERLGLTLAYHTYTAENYQDKTYDEVCLERARNNSDDLYLLNTDTIVTLGSEGHLADLSGLSCAQNLREVVRTANTVDGKLVAIPQEVVAYGLFGVNKDIFDECELSLPNTPEEFSGMLPGSQREGL